MDVGSVREGIKTVLAVIPGSSVHATIPRTIPAGSTETAIVVEPGTPYVTYNDGASGNIRQAVLRFTLSIIPATVDMTEAQQRIDDYLSAGAAANTPAQTRSIYDRLHGAQSLNGTVCMVNVMTADVVRAQVQVQDNRDPGVTIEYAAGQIHIEVLVRTR